MLRTRLCEVLGIEVPIVCAPFGPWEQVDLAAAVCEAGALGSLGTAVRTRDELVEQWERLRSLTERPFAINHTVRPFDEDAFAATLEFGPRAISFHLGVDADLVAAAHDAGILWIQQVMDREQAEAALEAGADVLIAQGAEAGGNGGWVGTMVLTPQVVDVAGEVPVVAAGGIADGRGIAAALVLGAQGASLGTRFLATAEMAIAQEWKQRIVQADATEAVKVANSERVLPPFNRPGWPAQPRALTTALIEQLSRRPDSVDPAEIGPRIVQAVRAGRGHDEIPFTGQSAGLIGDIVPAGELVRRLVAETAEALAALR